LACRQDADGQTGRAGGIEPRGVLHTPIGQRFDHQTDIGDFGRHEPAFQCAGAKRKRIGNGQQRAIFIAPTDRQASQASLGQRSGCGFDEHGLKGNARAASVCNRVKQCSQRRSVKPHAQDLKNRGRIEWWAGRRTGGHGNRRSRLHRLQHVFLGDPTARAAALDHSQIKPALACGPSRSGLDLRASARPLRHWTQRRAGADFAGTSAGVAAGLDGSAARTGSACTGSGSAPTAPITAIKVFTGTLVPLGTMISEQHAIARRAHFHWSSWPPRHRTRVRLAGRHRRPPCARW